MGEREVLSRHVADNVGWSLPHGEPFISNPPEAQVWVGIPAEDHESYPRYLAWREGRSDWRSVAKRDAPTGLLAKLRHRLAP